MAAKMLKVTVVPTNPGPFTLASMEIGDLGIVSDGEYKGHILLRNHLGVVSLTNPVVTWSQIACGNVYFTVELLRPGSKVTLEV